MPLDTYAATINAVVTHNDLTNSMDVAPQALPLLSSESPDQLTRDLKQEGAVELLASPAESMHGPTPSTCYIQGTTKYQWEPTENMLRDSWATEEILRRGVAQGLLSLADANHRLVGRKLRDSTHYKLAGHRLDIATEKIGEVPSATNNWGLTDSEFTHLVKQTNRKYLVHAYNVQAYTKYVQGLGINLLNREPADMLKLETLARAEDARKVCEWNNKYGTITNQEIYTTALPDGVVQADDVSGWLYVPHEYNLSQSSNPLERLLYCAQIAFYKTSGKFSATIQNKYLAQHAKIQNGKLVTLGIPYNYNQPQIHHRREQELLAVSKGYVGIKRESGYIPRLEHACCDRVQCGAIRATIQEHYNAQAQQQLQEDINISTGPLPCSEEMWKLRWSKYHDIYDDKYNLDHTVLQCPTDLYYRPR